MAKKGGNAQAVQNKAAQAVKDLELKLQEKEQQLLEKDTIIADYLADISNLERELKEAQDKLASIEISEDGAEVIEHLESEESKSLKAELQEKQELLEQAAEEMLAKDKEIEDLKKELEAEQSFEKVREVKRGSQPREGHIFVTGENGKLLEVKANDPKYK